MTENSHMLSVADAIARVTDGFSLIGSEQVGLSDAVGRVLAEDLNSRRNQPPVAVSSMDGYAVRTEDIADVPASLMQRGVSRAGDGYNGVVGAGECVRIFTGAPVPEGADAEPQSRTFAPSRTDRSLVMLEIASDTFITRRRCPYPDRVFMEMREVSSRMRGSLLLRESLRGKW